MSGDLGFEEMLRVAARITKEHGCEVRLGMRGGFSVRPLEKRAAAVEKTAATSTERVRKHRLERKLAQEKSASIKPELSTQLAKNETLKSPKMRVPKEVKREGQRDVETSVDAKVKESSLCDVLHHKTMSDVCVTNDLGTAPPPPGENAVDRWPLEELRSEAGVSANHDAAAGAAAWQAELTRSAEAGSETFQPVSAAGALLAPSFPPSPSSPRPPSSSPALSPVPPRACTRRLRRKAKREHEAKLLAANEAQAANAVPLPNRLDTRQFQRVWTEWCNHRTTLATLNPMKLWTAKAAQSTLVECAQHGEKSATEAIHSAIANGWQGLVWERVLGLRKAIKSAQEHRGQDGHSSGWSGRERPRNQAYLAEDAMRGLTPEQISGF